ncbi:hypothetical protein PT974_10592 [Cladobotryum mycophilum]|uniref:Uncharacterized protein n=1 Tax=Cladobotryum mycophilum TaxID=491253 RepID=A0ABR0SAA2_9HYPO
MLSYIVGIIAVLLFFANPIIQIFFPQEHRTSKSSARPQLNESLLAIDGPNATAAECLPDSYAARVLSREPEPLFEPSTITHDSSATHRDTTVRDSSVALLPRTNTVRCIEARARGLQGWRRDVWLERLRTQRYVAGGITTTTLTGAPTAWGGGG